MEMKTQGQPLEVWILQIKWRPDFPDFGATIIEGVYKTFVAADKRAEELLSKHKGSIEGYIIAERKIQE